MRILGRLATSGLVTLVLLSTLLCVRLTTGLPSTSFEVQLDRWSGTLATALAAVLIAYCAFRGGKRSDGWLLIAAGQAFWALGSLCYAVVLWSAAAVPYPSLADLGWIAFYIPTYAGIILLARERAGGRQAASPLDGAIAALAIAGVGAALVFGAIVDATGGSQLAIATNLLYPLADLALLALIVGALAVSGWQLGRSWAMLSLGCVLFAATDTYYVFLIAEDTYVAGTLIDAGWVLASMVTALAVWQPQTVAVVKYVRG